MSRRLRALAVGLLSAFGLAACALPSLQPAPSGFEHDGYVLSCQGVEPETCRRRAEAEADLFFLDQRSAEIRWIVIAPGEAEVCAARGPMTFCYFSETLGTIP